MLIAWTSFILLVVALLALDLGVFHRKSHVIKVREALAWTAFWVALGVAFTAIVYFLFENHWWGFGTNIQPSWPHNGKEAAKMYLAGYLLEKSLSVDNIFVIALIFSFFKVPGIHQHRVLFWGILGALIMRGFMIILGTELVERFTWMIYVFGIVLIATAVRMLFSSDEDVEPDRNPLVRFARWFYPVTPDFEGSRFFTRMNGKRAVTPLFLVILVIESTDLLFAIDSIPAIIGITHDPFLVFTSNVFAILGLRSLYFALAGMLGQFRYLKVSLVILLILIGVKMLLTHWVHIPINAALAIIAGILGLGVIASVAASRSEQLLAGLAYMEVPINLGKVAWNQIRRLVIFVVGSTVVLVGIIMLMLPGPGVFTILLGLLILSAEFVWAQRLLKAVKRRILIATGRCPHCSTSLRGLKAERCPQCNEPIGPLPKSSADASKE